MPRLEEKSGHAFCACAKHASNLMGGVPAADAGFSTCSSLRGGPRVHGTSGGDYDLPRGQPGEWSRSSNCLFQRAAERGWSAQSRNWHRWRRVLLDLGLPPRRKERLDRAKAQVKSMTASRLVTLGASIPLSAAWLWVYLFNRVEVSALAIVTGPPLAGFIGWTAYIVDGRDSEQKRPMGALRLGQEQADRLAQPD